jgi:hypothetical protein
VRVFAAATRLAAGCDGARAFTDAVAAVEDRFLAVSGIEMIVGAHLGNADGFRLAEPQP